MTAPIAHSCPHPSDRSTLLFPARDYVSGDTFRIVRCDACGLVRTEPRPDDAAWGRYYPDAYYGAAGSARFPSLVEALQDRLYDARARRVHRLNRGPGRVLDIGCGRGFLLRRFQRLGWQVMGTEMSAAAAAHARDVLGLPVEIGDVTRLGLPAASVDAVVLWHVLEHVAEPAALLAEAARLLRPGGVALVGVPDFGSPEARWARAGWLHLDVPRHLAHFTRGTLERMMRDAGLATEERSGFAPEYDLFSFVQSALNRLGIRQNLLYEMLRGRGAKVLGSAGGSQMQAAVTLALSPPLAVIGVVATTLAGAAGAGATTTAYARRT